ncbi:transporter [Klebsiella variicola]
MSVTNVTQTKESSINVPFTLYDLGWVVLCIGMAIGVGIIYMPIQIGMKGIWVFLLSVAISYPAVHYIQNLYLKTLTLSETGESYTEIISIYLGKKWGGIMGAAYFLMILTGILNYSVGLVNDSGAYLKTFKLTEVNLSGNWLYALLIITGIVLVASKGERLLFKISGPMIIFKLGVIILLGLVMIPHWSAKNISAIPSIAPLIRDTLLTLPFSLFSILFVQILSPMNLAYKKTETNPAIAAYRAVRVNRIAFCVLIVAVLFFALSFSFSFTKEQAEFAAKENISVLALTSQILPGKIVDTLAILLNIFALLSAFFSIYLAFEEAVRGMLINLFNRSGGRKLSDNKYFSKIIMIIIIAILWVWVNFNISVLFIMQLAGPVFGLVTCLIPFYLSRKIKNATMLRTPSTYFVLVYGLLLIISPFFKFFE